MFSVTIIKKAGKKLRITKSDVVKALKNVGVHTIAKKVEISDMRDYGVYEASVRISYDNVMFQVWIVMPKTKN